MLYLRVSSILLNLDFLVEKNLILFIVRRLLEPILWLLSVYTVLWDLIRGNSLSDNYVTTSI